MRRWWQLVVLLLPLAIGAMFLLDRYPVPGADEPGFIDPAVNLARHGSLATDLYRDVLPGMDEHVYWQPPGYFVVLAGWFRVVGVGLVQARLLSLLAAAGVVAVTYVAARRVVPGPWTAVGVATVGTCVWIGRASRFTRMDSLCVLLVLSTIVVEQHAVETGRRRSYVLAGALAGAAVLVHPIGSIAIVSVFIDLLVARRADRRETLLSVAAPFAVALGIWAMWAALDIGAFRQQMWTQLVRKEARGLHSVMDFFRADVRHGLVLLVLAGGGLWLVNAARRRADLRPFAIAAAVSIAAFVVGAEPFYVLYGLPFLAIGVAGVLRDVPITRVVVVIAIAAELVGLAQNVQQDRDDLISVARDSTFELVPPGSTVMLGRCGEIAYFVLEGRNPMQLLSPTPPVGGYSNARAARGSDYVLTCAGPAELAALVPQTRLVGEVGHLYAVYEVQRANDP